MDWSAEPSGCLEAILGILSFPMCSGFAVEIQPSSVTGEAKLFIRTTSASLDGGPPPDDIGQQQVETLKYP